MNDKDAEVDALVHAYLAKQAEQIDGEAGLARVRHAMEQATPSGGGWWRRGLRFALVSGMAATILLAFFTGWNLGPTPANARELVQEAKRIHNQPLARCYLVEIQPLTKDLDERAPVGKPARQVQVWTRGDRFWVEMQHEHAPAFVWGRGEDGSLWGVLDSHRGVRAPLDQTPRPLQVLADFYSLNVDTLLNDVLHDCTLTEEPSLDSHLTRVISATPRSDRMKLWLRDATLEIDTEAKVVRRLVITRNRLGKTAARVTFTLIETRPDDDTKYRLEGHLDQPFRIHEGNIGPLVKLELLGRWFGVRNGKADAKAKQDVSATFKDIEGRTQTPFAQPGQKATVLFFVIPDCPIVNAHAPEIQRISKEYEAKKVASILVYADPDVTTEQARKHCKEYGITCTALLDPTHVLVKKTGVTIAPEVAVLDPAGTVVYRGRIDDLYVDYGKRRPAPTQRDLRVALDEILQGKAVSTPLTKAIGCFLPEPKK